MDLKNITFLIVTYRSDKKVLSCLKNLPKESKKIVIENSGNEILKKKLINKFTNINVEVMNENLGYGKANNIGIKLSVTDYVFILNPDVTLKLSQLNIIFKILKNQNFAIASPIERIDIKKFNFLDNNQLEVDFVKGFAMILNKNKFKGKFFDENIFLYLEEMDLCKRMRLKNERILLLNVPLDHLGGSSHDKVYDLEMEKSRNWHWMWSKFYYYKKYYGYFYGLFKTIPNFFSSSLKFVYYKFTKQNNQKEKYKMRFLGLYNSYLLKNSNYRPYSN